MEPYLQRRGAAESKVLNTILFRSTDSQLPYLDTENVAIEKNVFHVAPLTTTHDERCKIQVGLRTLCQSQCHT
jgi:hypothetical protein